MKNELPGGVYPVMLQPFHLDTSMDWDGLRALVDFYIGHGSAGLFAACGSTEVTHMTRDEVLSVVEKTVTYCGGRAPVVAGAIFNQAPVDEQASFVREVAARGADAVAITASMMALPEENEDVFLGRVMRLLDLTGDIPLGIYEAPTPYHRLMPPDTFGRIAATGRFVFHKDTCCDAATISEKLDAIAGTPLRLFNAHAHTLLHSLREGGAGYSGTGANFYPEIYVELCGCAAADPMRAEEIQAFLDTQEPLLANNGYPQTAKLFLQSRGLPITSRIRQERSVSFSEFEDLLEARRRFLAFTTSPALIPA